VIAYTVSVDHRFVAFTGRRRRTTLDGLGGVRKEETGGHGGDLQGAAFDPPVPTVAGVVGDRDLTPGQRLELGV
jgi:hypothetical protein